MSDGKKKTSPSAAEDDIETIVESCECLQAFPTINIEGNVYIGYSPEQIVQIIKGIGEIAGLTCDDCKESCDHSEQ